MAMDVSPIPHELTDGIRAYAAETGCMEEPEPLFRAITMPELMDGDYSITYLCRGVLAEGQPAIMGGPQKAFKTSLALELAVCLAMGRPFLNQFNVPTPVKVCYFSGEGGMGVIQDTLRRIGQIRGINISEVENLTMTDTVPRLDNIEHLDALQEYVAEQNPKVIFVDPLYLAMSGADTSNVFSMGERLKALNDVCQPTGCTPVLIHHLKKNRFDKFKPAGLEDLSMAGFAEYAGQWILLSRRDEYDPDNPTHRLWISFGGRTGHGSQWGLDINEIENVTGQRIWRPQLHTQEEVRSERNARRDQHQRDREREREADLVAATERVFTWMQSRPNGVTKQNTKDSNCCPAAKAGIILQRLLDDGRIEPCQVEVPTGTGSRQVPGYRIAAANEETEV